MKKIGELNGMNLIIANNPNEVKYNDILVITEGDKIKLKKRNNKGELVSLVGDEDSCDVIIQKDSSIKGSKKWIKGENYLFCINKNDKFVIRNTTTMDTLTNVTNLIATGKTDKVYEIAKDAYSSIIIEEV